MSGFSDLVNSGADCGPVNPLASFAKQFNQDNSLHHDRFAAGEGSSRMQLRNRPAGDISQDREFSEEFFRNSQHHHAIHGHPPQDLFQFNELKSEIEHIDTATGAPLSSQQLEHHEWTNDFAKFQNSAPANHLIRHEDFREFEQIYNRPHNAQWAQEFSRFQHHRQELLKDMSPETHAALEKAFEEAKAENDWVGAFTEAENLTAERNSESLTENDALAQTAGALLASIDTSSNSKFKNSKFLDFMQKLRDQEVSIEGNKVVSQISAKGSAETRGGTWASEFNDRVENFIANQAQSEQSDGNIWTEEFAKTMEKNWVEEFDEEFIKNHAQEFDGADIAFKNADDTADWIRQYEQSMAEFSESLKNVQSDDPEWQSLQNDWDRHAESSAFRADNPLYDHYEFEPDNPYLTLGTPHLELSAHNRTLPEEILALEAAVQTDPSNASAWYQLGTRQQENERESQAIAALRKAVELDPKVLDAWLALAVSYTNENCEQDSLDALESWISHHQRYKVILEEGRVRNGGGSRFDYVSSLFLEAARSNPGEDLDADVQVGLGVLFNLSEEYEKAVDCFEAALAKRPDDYLLWNKLGATLANSHSTTRAIDAYFHALQINPSFIRARYNLAISCINMGQHREAAEHLLVALTLQIGGDEWEVEWNDDGKGKGPAGSRKVRVTSGFMSSNVWDTLKMACLLMNRGDLVKFCDERNVDGFRNEFEF